MLSLKPKRKGSERHVPHKCARPLCGGAARAAGLPCRAQQPANIVIRALYLLREPHGAVLGFRALRCGARPAGLKLASPERAGGRSHAYKRKGTTSKGCAGRRRGAWLPPAHRLVAAARMPHPPSLPPSGAQMDVTRAVDATLDVIQR